MPTKKKDNTTNDNFAASGQSIKTGNINARGKVVISQTISTVSQNIVIQTRQEFQEKLGEFISALEKHKAEPNVSDAIEEIKSAKEEAEKAEPSPSLIRRFLNSAKGLLSDTAKTITAISSVTVGITTLLTTIKIIFGG